jgi:c-di-GMP-binding flagellar brake protein YcgR
MNWDGVTERRRFRRAKIRLRLEFQGRAGTETSPVEMQTLNLGAGGFYCRVAREIPALTRLALRFVFPPFGREHPAARTIECEAIVVRCDADRCTPSAYRLGACFSRMEPADRRYIDQYVAWYREVYETGASEDGREREAA